MKTLLTGSAITKSALGIALSVVMVAGAAGEPMETVFVAMRDGTRLATDVYLPAEGEGPFPGVLIRTPYNKDNRVDGLLSMALHRGYAVVAQDLRGRYASEGRERLAFESDGWGKNRDGHDTIEWIIRQPWSDGNVATWGASAEGITQNMLAPGAPAALKAQHVRTAFSNAYGQATYQGGVFRKSLAEGWLKGFGFGDEAVAVALAHPCYDGLWAGFNMEAEAERINAPAVHLGGWFDVFLQGTINAFTAAHNRGGPGARGKCRLIIGPWDHELVCLVEQDPFWFFDYYLKGIDSPQMDERPVRYFVMGDPDDPEAPGKLWRSADNWPPPATPTRFFLHADGGLGLDPPEIADASLTYQYDPANPVPTIGGQNMNMWAGPLDQREVESRPDVLVFTGEPLAEPLEVTGRVTAKFFVSSDCPDTDFTVKLTCVFPNGASHLLADGILRARFRESFERERFLEPGNIYPLTVDLWSTSVVFKRGSRIRVDVSSSNFPRFDVNPNTGRPPGKPGAPRVATNTLHLSPEHPSHIILPVYAEPAGPQPPSAGSREVSE